MSAKRKGSSGVADAGPESKRRKSPPEEDASSGDENATTTKVRESDAPPNSIRLSELHKATLTQLKPKYDVAVMSVISSTKIRNRVTRIVEHLQEASGTSDGAETKLLTLALVHARPSEVCKMITITERVKAILNAEGKTVYQYNHLFEVQPKPEHREAIEETVLERPGEDDDQSGEDDGFEQLKVYEQAANPKKPQRKTKSLAIFVSIVPVPELKSKTGMTEQVYERG
ncbi:hypothetical protein jhhlp_007636 [Lomentospora prolificans]|uniref:DNA/RNA-binding protein Alba-like domain-containing protein n=1 Tax=Lomentospora prolificans TaxID=41688 RepID=A0A2N3N046_9PEZI|nr:hypothetical protein jhhlp_007636 [Lomentospora prolificans]